MAFRNSRVITRSKPRVSQWTATVPQTAVTVLAAATAIIDSTFVTDVNNPETLIRVRGNLMVQTDQNGASETPFGAIGMAVVSNEAVAAGVAAILTPYAEGDSDYWFMHQYWAAPIRFGTAVGFQNVGVQYVIDSKAMRKVTPDQTIILVMENGSADSGLQYRLDLRILSKVA